MNDPTRLICERRSYSQQCHTHSHTFAQLILPLQGILSIKTELHDAALGSQHLFFFPPFCNHTFHSDDRNESLVLDIPLSLFATEEIKYMKGSFCQSLDSRWQALKLLMLNETADQPAHSQAIHDLFRYASRLLMQQSLPNSITFIHEHYHEKLTLEQLAALEHYNPSYYCEWFQKRTGQTPMTYIKKLRLNRAKELLSQTSLPVLRIAQEVGYEHQSTLTKIFQQEEKISPSAYRRNKQKSAK